MGNCSELQRCALSRKSRDKLYLTSVSTNEPNVISYDISHRGTKAQRRFKAGALPQTQILQKLCGSVPLCENSTATLRMKSRGKQMLGRDAIRRGRVLPLLSGHGPIGFAQWPNWLRSMAKRSRAHAQRKVLASLLHCFGVNSQPSWRQLNRVLTPTRRAVHRRKRGWPQAESAWPQEDSGLAT